MAETVRSVDGMTDEEIRRASEMLRGQDWRLPDAIEEATRGRLRLDTSDSMAVSNARREFEARLEDARRYLEDFD